MDRYSDDVLSPGWQQKGKPVSSNVPLELGMVVEDPSSGFVGEIVGWENGLVVLEDRKNKRRSFPVGPGFWLDGKPVTLQIPLKQGTSAPKYTASGSRASSTPEVAQVAKASRIYVEGRHDAELVEKVWGDDLRHVGIVVQYLGGIDDLPAIVADFAPEPGRRLGVLVDHLVVGSKESRIAREVMQRSKPDTVMITGHEFIDIWNAIKPETLGFKTWPVVPRDEDFKKGTLKRLGLAHNDQTDIAKAWQAMLARVTSFRDLAPRLNTEVEKLIDFVTQDHH